MVMLIFVFDIRGVVYHEFISDFFLSPKLKLPPRCTRFDSIEAIKQNSWKELKAILESTYKKYFEDCKNAGICVLH